MNVTSLFPHEGDVVLGDELQRLASEADGAAFDPLTMEFVGRIAQELLRPEQARRHPELAALGQWFRPSRLRKMRDRVFGDEIVAIKPRGLVFIVAPSNVDVMFIYGWFLSLLNGNTTLVRLSQKENTVVYDFLDVVRSVVDSGEFTSLLARSWLLTYDHDSEATREISALCDARLIWGGDGTVTAIREVPLNPLAVEIAFADRFSLAVFSSSAMAGLDTAQLEDLARRFANDTLIFDQQACSSPRTVFWVGTKEDVAAQKERFWSLFSRVVGDFENDAAMTMARAGNMFSLAAAGMISGRDSDIGALPSLARTDAMPSQLREQHSGHGVMVEQSLDHLSELAGYLQAKDQTLVAFGFTNDELGDLVAKLPRRSVDRIVRPGQATEFDSIWDGVDLLQVLTRKVTVFIANS